MNSLLSGVQVGIIHQFLGVLEAALKKGPTGGVCNTGSKQNTWAHPMMCHKHQTPTGDGAATVGWQWWHTRRHGESWHQAEGQHEKAGKKHLCGRQERKRSEVAPGIHYQLIEWSFKVCLLPERRIETFWKTWEFCCVQSANAAYIIYSMMGSAHSG